MDCSAKDLQFTESSKANLANLARLGYLGRDAFGRIYLDTCETNEAHLKNQVAGKERPGCRTYIEDLFPESLLGQRVAAIVDVFLVVHKESK